MKTTTEFEVGQRVCVVGEGTATGRHQHGKVKRITEVERVIVVEFRNYTERFRPRRNLAPVSIPYSAYGGSTVHPTCQKPKESN